LTRCGSTMLRQPAKWQCLNFDLFDFSLFATAAIKGASMGQEVTTRMVKSLTLALILLLAARLENAQACLGPHQRTFPTCEIGAPRSDERTAVVYVNGGSALSSVTPGSDGMVTEVVDVEIGVADKPHYIVLSSGKPIIWRFKGRIDAISRVVVLGSQFNGGTRNGVVGVPRDRIVFARTDVEKLKSRMTTRSSCDSFYGACEASAYFDIPRADRMHLAGDAPSERYGADQFVERVTGDVIRIPQDGWTEVGERESWRQWADGWQSKLGRHELVGGEGYIETSQNYERGLIKIDAASVVSPETVRDYSILPAAEGIRQLLADGSLAGPDDARFKAAYERWNERISRPYRSKLDPGFLFSYKVSYLTTRPMTLPAALYRTAFLVDEGVDAPDMSGNSYRACLYYADLRGIQVDPRKSRDPRCVGESPLLGSLVFSESERQIASAAWSFDRMQQASQADKDKCKILTVAGDAYFAGIAVSESAARPPAAARRRIDVIVERPGKVALYLEKSSGRTDWYILPSGADADHERRARRGFGPAVRSSRIGSVCSGPDDPSVCSDPDDADGPDDPYDPSMASIIAAGTNSERLPPIPAAQIRAPRRAGGA
jgi:hypothetical protein